MTVDPRADRQRTQRIIAIVGYSCLGLVLVAMVVAGFIWPQRSASVSTPQQTEAIDQVSNLLTVAELRAAYEQNEISADQRFKGRLIELSGVVGDVATDVAGTPYITLEEEFGGRYQHPTVQAFFARNSTSNLTSLRRGSRSLIRCRGAGKMINIYLRECRVLR